MEEKRPATQSQVQNKPASISPSPAVKSQGTASEPKGAAGGGSRDDYLGLKDEMEPSKLPR